MHRILIVRSCAIGDFVLHIPTLTALTRTRPDIRFTLAGYPSTLELAREFVPVERIHSIDLRPWSTLFYEPVPGLEFDQAIVWMRDPIVAENLKRSGIPDVIHAEPFPQYGHAATHLLRTLHLPEPPLPDLWKPENDEIVIHASSGSEKKNWPYFDQLSRQSASFTPLGTQPSLLDVVRKLQHCRAYVGNDSGITHIAAYIGCPTLALFGPTDPRVWGPIGLRSRIIWKTNLKDISVNEVMSALTHLRQLR